MYNSSLWLGLIALIYATPAYCYIDPGTGSIVIQLIFAFVASGFFWFGRVKDLLINLVKNIVTRKTRD